MSATPGSDAIQEKLAAPHAEEKPWMKYGGGLKHLHDETMRINENIEEEFERIEPEDY